jgi:hypothetical protein
VRKGVGSWGKGLTCNQISEPDGCERGDRVVDAHNVIPLILTELYSFYELLNAARILPVKIQGEMWNQTDKNLYTPVVY